MFIVWCYVERRAQKLQHNLLIAYIYWFNCYLSPYCSVRLLYCYSKLTIAIGIKWIINHIKPYCDLKLRKALNRIKTSNDALRTDFGAEMTGLTGYKMLSFTKSFWSLSFWPQSCEQRPRPTPRPLVVGLGLVGLASDPRFRASIYKPSKLK